MPLVQRSITRQPHGFTPRARGPRLRGSRRQRPASRHPGAHRAVVRPRRHHRNSRASMKHELRHMRTQGSGAIVNCSSLGGLVGLPGRAAYHASKHGVIGLTKSAALEYAPRGIRINAICPGTIDTPMVANMISSGELDPAQALANQPIGRFGRAEEIASTVLWLCSPGSSYVLGVALPVDG